MTLFTILQLDVKNDKEVKSLLERALTLHINSGGCKSHNVAMCIMNNSIFHLKRAKRLPLGSARTEQLRIAEKYCKQGLGICTKINGSIHPVTLSTILLFSEIASAISVQQPYKLILVVDKTYIQFMKYWIFFVVFSLLYHLLFFFTESVFN